MLAWFDTSTDQDHADTLMLSLCGDISGYNTTTCPL
jgi:hypothetical protein